MLRITRRLMGFLWPGHLAVTVFPVESLRGGAEVRSRTGWSDTVRFSRVKRTTPLSGWKFRLRRCYALAPVLVQSRAM